MRIAVVGAGVSGLLAAWLLRDRHDVTLYEAAPSPGGHAHTLALETPHGPRAVDTGFVVFNDRTYPEFVRLLGRLGVESQTSDMSFSVRAERARLEYRGSSLGTLFAQRSNLLRPRLYRMLWDVLSFNRRAPEVLADASGEEPTVGDLLDRHRYGRTFLAHYLVPMASAVWSAPAGRVREMPARMFVAFFQNHGFLQLRGRPVWRVVRGGSRRYVERLAADLGGRLRLATPVAGVRRRSDGVVVRTASGEAARHDQVVLACHSDQALALLEDPRPAELEILGAIPYQQNEGLLHGDPALMPRRKRAWASWNYLVSDDADRPATVTYHMNLLQGLPEDPPFFVTLNPMDLVNPTTVLARLSWAHPLYTLDSWAAQGRKAEISGVGRTWYAGAYWGYGFHEDGVRSALDVARGLGVEA